MPLRCIILTILVSAILLGMFIPQAVFAQGVTSTPIPILTDGISEPKPDDVIFGTVEIFGTSSAAWDLAFSPNPEVSDSWVSLAQSNQPVSGGILATWETSVLQDGDYYLRLRVHLTDIQQELVVKVSVSNRIPTQPSGSLSSGLGLTATPSLPELLLDGTSTEFPKGNLSGKNLATETVSDDLLAVTPSAPLVRTQTPMKNPATLDPRDILIYLAESIMAVMLVFVAAGLMFYLRRK